jgi:hypothetical protein
VSVVRPLPPRPHLGNLKKQAKLLLAAWRAGDPQAVAAIRQWHPRGEILIAAGRHTLADAQLVVARGYGFASWAGLVRHVGLPAQSQDLYTVDRWFRATLTPEERTLTVGQILDRRVERVWKAHLDGQPAAATLLRAVGGADGGSTTVDEIRAVIAREHGFADWATAAAHYDRPMDHDFEAAVDAVVSGDLDTVHTLLNARPELATARSSFGHHATLIHYLTANGVETSRQWASPRNAPELARLLLYHGADPNAECDSYAGGPATTPLCLLVSSAHPAHAGVQADLVVELCRGGANPNGLDEDGLPLWTAITFGYPEAVDALARCDARTDNLIFAASVGDLAAVERLLTSPSTDRAYAMHRIGAHGPLLDPAHLVEYALIYSAGLGRRRVVERLLDNGPDLNVTEPRFRSTAAGMARYHRRHDILAVLEAT